MGSGKRGALAVVGIIVGFLTLVFVSQMFRYMTPALYGDQLSLGMWGIYVVLTYCGATVSLWSFIPRVSVGKYLGGAGGAVAAALVLLSLYLFVTGGIASGMMLLIITVGQIIAAGVVYVVAQSWDSDSASESDSAPSTEPSPERDHESGTELERESHSEPNPEPATTRVEPENTPNSPSESREHTDTDPAPHPETDSNSGWDIDWRTGGQLFAGVTLIIIGIPITVASPVGVPILVLGFALIPRVRSWSMRKLGRSTVD